MERTLGLTVRRDVPDGIEHLLDLAERHARDAALGTDSYAELLIIRDAPSIAVRFPSEFAGIAA